MSWLRRCVDYAHEVPVKANFNRWLAAGRCTGPRTATRSADQMGVIKFNAAQDIQVGNLLVHETHNMLTHRGLMWCCSCGAWATKLLKRLGAPCTRQLDKTGRQNLCRLYQGLTPKPDVEWPMPEGESFPWLQVRACKNWEELMKDAPTSARMGSMLERVRQRERSTLCAQGAGALG